MRSRKHAAIMALTAALALAGCGSSSSRSSSSGSSSGTLTHAELVARVNTLCAQRNSAIGALPKTLAHLTSMKAVASYLSDLIAIDGPLISKLEAVTPPASDKAVWDQAVKDNQTIYQLLGRAHSAAQAGNLAELQRLEIRLQPLNQRLKTAAEQLGLTECLKQPVPSA